MRSCFVTCGATVPFPALVDCMLSKEVLATLAKEGYERLIIQYGKEYDVEFNTACRDLAGDVSIEKGQVEGPGNEQLSGLRNLVVYRCQQPFKFEIVGFPYSNEIDSLLANHADLVVSHAGTGSILDSLRLNKPLIVVANRSLMDNHQQQTAEKFEELGHVISASPSKTQMCSVIESIKSANLKPLKNEPNQMFLNKLKSIVY